MDNARTGTIALGTSCRLTLSLTPVDADITLGSVDLTVNGRTIGTGFETSPQEAELFVRQLEWMHRDLAGEASLRGSMHRTAIRFVVTDARFGTIAASGEFVVEVFGDGRSYDSGVFIRFNNLMTDQSYLPEFIRGLREAG